MATPKKEEKERDAELTKNMFIDATGKIVAEDGFPAVTAIRLSAMTGKSPTMVNYHFGSLQALKHAYITRKEYWNPLLERYVLPNDAPAEVVRDTFIEIMLLSYDVFLKDREMQGIILKQMSKSSPFLYTLLQQREAKGRQLMLQAQKYFAGSKVNFKAILNLMLAAIYTNGLHARYNNGTFCWLDLNMESDRLEVRRTIAQVINWAFLHRND